MQFIGVGTHFWLGGMACLKFNSTYSAFIYHSDKVNFGWATAHPAPPVPTPMMQLSPTLCL